MASRDLQLIHVDSPPDYQPLVAGGQDHATAAPPANPLLLIHSLLRGRYKFAIPLAIILAVVGAYTGYKIKAPQYQSTGLIRIQPVVQRILYTNEQNSMMPMFDSFVETQAALLRGRNVVDLVMLRDEWRKLGRDASLEAKADFIEALTVTHPKSTEMIVVAFLDMDPNAAMLGVKLTIEEYRKLYGDNDAEGGAKRLQVLEERRVALTNDLFRINGQIKTVADKYGTDRLEPIYDSKLQEEIRVEADWKRMVTALSVAQASAKPSAPTTGPAVPATQPGATVDRQIAGAARLPATAPTELSAEAIAVVDAQTRDCLKTKSDLQRTVDRLSGLGMGEQHRSMVEARANLAIAHRSLEEAAENYRKAVAAGLIPRARMTEGGVPAGLNLDELRLQAQSLKSLFDAAHEETLAIGRERLKIDELREQASAARVKLDETKLRLEQLTIESQVSGRVNIISTGDRPVAPFNDKRKQMAAAGGMGGGALGIGLFLVIGWLDGRFRSVSDAHLRMRHVNRILGILPSLPSNLDDPEQAAVAAHCVHHIRALLQIHGSAAQQRVFAITSPSAGDGKTSLAMALGLSFAASGAKTLLIDCDIVGGGLTVRMDTIIRRKIGRILLQQGLLSAQQLAEALAMAQSTRRRLGEVLVALGYLNEADIAGALSAQGESLVGLVDVLAGEDLMDCVSQTGTAGLYSLPLGAAAASHSSQLSPAAVRRIVEQARKNFDTVLIDTGPLLGSLEAAIVATEADAVVLTVSRGEQRPLAEKAVEHLASIGAELAGVVFNRARVDDIEYSGFSSSYGGRSVMAGSLNRRDGSAPVSAAKMGPVASAVVSAGYAPGNGQPSGPASASASVPGRVSSSVPGSVPGNGKASKE